MFSLCISLCSRCCSVSFPFFPTGNYGESVLNGKRMFLNRNPGVKACVWCVVWGVTCNMTAEIALPLKLQHAGVRYQFTRYKYPHKTPPLWATQINRTEIYFKIHKMQCLPQRLFAILHPFDKTNTTTTTATTTSSSSQEGLWGKLMKSASHVVYVMSAVMQ